MALRLRLRRLVFPVVAIVLTGFAVWMVYWLFLPGKTSPDRGHSGTVTVHGK